MSVSRRRGLPPPALALRLLLSLSLSGAAMSACTLGGGIDLPSGSADPTGEGARGDGDGDGDDLAIDGGSQPGEVGGMGGESQTNPECAQGGAAPNEEQRCED